MPSTAISCRLVCHSPKQHIQQVYTGLSMLHRRGLIDLTQEIVSHDTVNPGTAQHLRDAAATHARVIVNDAVTVHYDMHDAQDINVRDLATCDYYFKRSYSRDYAGSLGSEGTKILPFGLNYHVLPNFLDLFAVRRAIRLPRTTQERIAAFRQALDVGNRLAFYPRVRELESPPNLDATPQVLFLVTAYDPYDNPDRSAEKIEERQQTNATRAQCIRLLRQEFGNRFLGGFNHNAYTVKHYPDCLASTANATDKAAYIRTLKAHAICVATTGLHGSIGWKFAEYVACARAIVTERLVYEVPGALTAGRHYLEFSSPSECVEQAQRLVADQSLCGEMMTANALYYRDHLRPDTLMMNSLLTALSMTVH